MYSRQTEIRHVTSADVYKLAQILDQTNSWKKLMRFIPKNVSINTAESLGKYSNDHIRLIENASIKQNRMSTEILFEEWGTSGQKRPTVGYLLDLLVKAELFRGADFVALNFLNEPPPKRPLKGPAAKIDISLPFPSGEIKEVEQILNNVSYPSTTNLLNNVNQSSNLNNKDFYTKLDRNNVKVEVNYSDLMKFSSTSSNTTDNIPDLSALVIQNIGSHETNEENNTESGINDSISYEQSSIPDLSTLNANESKQDELPNLSALHLTLEGSESSVSSQIDNDIFSNCIDHINSAPNLSILDQNNESDNLTQVSDNGYRNNFSIESKLVVLPDEEDLPCLSALNK